MAAFSKVLSQHGLLKTLCAHLSAADIVHLAATSQEHRTYVTSSKPILELLMSNAICDGLGVLTRACVFGEGNGDPLKIRNKCLGADAKPCSDCSTPVCDVSLQSLQLVHQITDRPRTAASASTRRWLQTKRRSVKSLRRTRMIVSLAVLVRTALSASGELSGSSGGRALRSFAKTAIRCGCRR